MCSHLKTGLRPSYELDVAGWTFLRPPAGTWVTHVLPRIFKTCPPKSSSRYNQTENVISVPTKCSKNLYCNAFLNIHFPRIHFRETYGNKLHEIKRYFKLIFVLKVALWQWDASTRKGGQPLVAALLCCHQAGRAAAGVQITSDHVFATNRGTVLSLFPPRRALTLLEAK